jgi:FixJ family two-component response regulator/glycine cleavage system H lipoate-binding protein
MSNDRKLLVVDDEASICQACRRVFTRQGFEVDESCDPHAGLALAEKNEYAAVLLDIKMPTMDGIEFLETLRTKKPSIPVIFMTGYPSVPTATSAVRLGAAGYIMKPFTPEEITQAIQKFIPRSENGEAAARAAAAESWTPAPKSEVRFWHEAWFQKGMDDAVRAGVALTRNFQNGLKNIRLPKIGEVVFQGLPMSSVETADGSKVVIPAPVSGVVVSVNETLSSDLSPLVHEPCTAGWIATICPTRLEEESNACKPRRVVLLNSDAASAREQSEKLSAQGCTVRCLTSGDDLVAQVAESTDEVLVLHSAAFGEAGPNLVARLNAAVPELKIVVLASPNCTLEPAYRSRKIFYYAVEPFADNEIADILDAAFRPHEAPKPPAERVHAASEQVAFITTTNRNGTKVELLSAPGLLQRGEGLGGIIRRNLLGRLMPIEMIAGESKINPTNIVNRAAACDRLIVLLAGDAGRLPGSLIRDTKSEFITITGDTASKVTTLVIQSGADGNPPALDARTQQMLAAHVVTEVATC